MNNQFKKWTLAIIATYQFLLSIIIQIVLFFIRGEFNIGFVVGSFLANALGVIINIIYVQRKKDETPVIDTKVRNNMIKYIVFASQIVFLIFTVVLIIATLYGMETIPMIYLWIAMGINMGVISIGALIVLFR